MDEGKVDIKLSTVKPLHCKTKSKAYNFFIFNSDKGKRIMESGWRAAGIIDALKNARSDSVVNDLVVDCILAFLSKFWSYSSLINLFLILLFLILGAIIYGSLIYST